MSYNFLFFNLRLGCAIAANQIACTCREAQIYLYFLKKEQCKQKGARWPCLICTLTNVSLVQYHAPRLEYGVVQLSFAY